MDQEQIKTVKEMFDIADMKQTIDKINCILTASEFDVFAARTVIRQVNEKYEENVCIYNIITYGSTPRQIRNSGIKIDVAPSENLIEDLTWKRFYLSAKIANKTVDIIEKEWRAEKQKDWF